MAADTEAKRRTLLAFVGAPRLPTPSGADMDAQAERFTVLGIYAGFAASIGSISTSSGARQRDRRLGLVGRV